MSDDAASQPPTQQSGLTPTQPAKIPHWLVGLIVIGLIGLIVWKQSQPGQHAEKNPADDQRVVQRTPGERPFDEPPPEGQSEPPETDSPLAVDRSPTKSISNSDDAPQGKPASNDARPTPKLSPSKPGEVRGPAESSPRASAPNKPASQTGTVAKTSPAPFPSTRPTTDVKPAPVVKSAPMAKPLPAKPAPAGAASKRMIINGVTIKDLDGKVVYRGDIDLTDTLSRIAAGKLLRYRNDGSVFQNRERRIPAKESGYYHEYVHETPEVDGPGPQRIVTGEGGEIYYTYDHYKTFKKLR